MEKKDIREYLKYYIGHPCFIGDSNKLQFIRMINERSVCTNVVVKDDGTTIPIWYKASACKPHLSRLEDITSEDSATKDEICSGIMDVYKAAKLTDYLRSKGYWLGSNDWFDEGIIIDKKTLQS